MIPDLSNRLQSDKGVTVGYMVQAVAEQTHIPVMLHLDHGDSQARVAECIRAGYSSVMFDGERLPIRENAAMTRTVAEFAHGAGVSVEAGADSFGAGEGSNSEVTLSNPDDVLCLRNEGNADMVACSAGSRHGESSRLDLERLELIHRVTNSPIVIHGGSGIDDDDVRAATALGVVKLNIGSAIVRAVNRTVAAGNPYYENGAGTATQVIAAVMEAALQKIRLTNSSNQGFSL